MVHKITRIIRRSESQDERKTAGVRVFKSFRFSHFYEEMMSHDALFTGGENAREKEGVN